MKRIETLLLTGGLVIIGLMTQRGYAQTFTFNTIAGGSQGRNDGANSNAQFYNPTGVAVDGGGNVYVADQKNNLIRKITPSGTNWIVTTIAGGGQGSLDGTNTSAQFFGPTGIAIDSATNLYVADQFNYTIRKITLAGTNWVTSTIAGQAGVFGAHDGANTNAQFYNPTGVAVDHAGNIFVADEFNNAIRKITPQGTNWIVSTIAGGSNSAAQFFDPAGVAVDANDRIFVADQFNNTIRLITPMGTNWVVTTIAGQSISGFSNGLGTNALFDSPVSVAVDTNDNVYVADQFNEDIRELVPSGTNWEVSTIGGGSLGTNNGIGTNASFDLPFGVATDAYGDVFVTDSGNNAIRLGLFSSGPPPTGGLEVTLTPSNAVAAGAQWQVDGGLFQQSGAILSSLTPGTHTITFSNVLGFTTPAYQITTVTAHQTATATGNYPAAIANAGSLQVFISPFAAVGAGAQWQVDDGPFQTNGAIVAGLSIGAHTLSFNTNSEWATSAAQMVVITNGQTTLGLGTYVMPNYTVTLSASPVSGGTVGGGGTFTAGSLLTVTATANPDYVFANWTQDGIVASTSTNDTFIIESNQTLVANFLPTYTLAVSASPAQSGTATGGGTNFPAGSSQTVTATANSGFEFIGWAGQATGTNNPLTVTMNTNLHVTAYFAASGSMTLTVITTGSGTVSPNLNGKPLKKGRSYTLTPTAGRGNVFSNWTGSITTNKHPFTVKMESSMVLQANFVPNPFLPVKGAYNGLFAMTNGVTEQTAGMLRGLTISQTGTYSGTLLINGASHPISGSFNLAGHATNHISRPASKGGPLTLFMTLNWNDSTPQVTGTVSGTNNEGPWVTTNLLADLATNNVPSGEYTMLIPPDTNNAPPVSSPGGDGYVLITNHMGKVTITGALADGTAFNQTTPVSQDGYLPIYANIYGSKGLLLGWINLDPTNTAGVSLTWIHPTRAAGLYQNGFTNVLLTNQILLSPWANPPANIDLLTNLSFLETINDTNAANFAVTMMAAGKVTGPLASGSINPKTGLLKVNIGTGPTKLTGYGAILLNGTNGGGYFLTETNAQAIQLGP